MGRRTKLHLNFSQVAYYILFRVTPLAFYPTQIVPIFRLLYYIFFRLQLFLRVVCAPDRYRNVSAYEKCWCCSLILQLLQREMYLMLCTRWSIGVGISRRYKETSMLLILYIKYHGRAKACNW